MRPLRTTLIAAAVAAAIAAAIAAAPLGAAAQGVADAAAAVMPQYVTVKIGSGATAKTVSQTTVPFV
ncbi:MAG: hypothetical protein ACYC7F_08190, partial [Gemmatimonadaceae bacterium]